jgi:hypothetical protein
MHVSHVSKKLLNEVRLTVERENAEPTTFTLVLDMNAICLLEEQTGIDITDPDTWKNLKHGFLTALVHAALQTHHAQEGIELREVRSWFQFGDPTLRDVFFALMGVKLEAGKREPQPEETTEQAGAGN